jgi:hypothetical protein
MNGAELLERWNKLFILLGAQASPPAEFGSLALKSNPVHPAGKGRLRSQQKGVIVLRG